METCITKAYAITDIHDWPKTFGESLAAFTAAKAKLAPPPTYDVIVTTRPIEYVIRKKVKPSSDDRWDCLLGMPLECCETESQAKLRAKELADLGKRVMLVLE